MISLLLPSLYMIEGLRMSSDAVQQGKDLGIDVVVGGSRSTKLSRYPGLEKDIRKRLA